MSVTCGLDGVSRKKEPGVMNLRARPFDESPDWIQSGIDVLLLLGFGDQALDLTLGDIGAV